MHFTTLSFIGFIIILLAAYYLFPLKYRWLVLFAASMLFYALLARKSAAYILVSGGLTWLAGMALDKWNTAVKALPAGEGAGPDTEKRAKQLAAASKAVMVLFVAGSIAALLFLKFFNFFQSSLLQGSLRLVVPVGVSFYTLQVISYIIDLYEGKTEAEKNPLKVMLFTSFFPQLLQGPISRFLQLQPQLAEGHQLQYNNLVLGAERMLWGYFKKLVIADRIAIFTDTVFAGYESYRGFYMAAAAVLYALQLYTDFSGGIDIALGAARLFGIEMQENFNRPFFSKNIAEFWRRWHISLGAWFRDYVYYPLNLALARSRLGQSRAGRRLPVYISLLVVWLLNGVWHGAGLQYICQGLWYGLLIILGTATQKPMKKLRAKLHISPENKVFKLFQIVRTFLLVATAQLMFRSESFGMMCGVFKSLFSVWNPGVLFDGSLLDMGISGKDFIVLAVALVILFAAELAARSKNLYEWLFARRLPLRWAVYLGGLIVILIFGIYGESYAEKPFIYFQF